MYIGDGEGNAWYGDEQDEDQQWLANKQKVKLANQSLQSQENINKKKKTTLVKFNEDVQTKMIDDDSMEDEEDFDEEEEGGDDEKEEESSVVKEDIYGRTIDAKGNVVKTNSSKTNSIISYI